jgi:hypothetical protein
MTSEAWYIVKQPDGHCEVIQSALSQDEIIPNEGILGDASINSPDANSERQQPGERWGPFASQAEAIARRVGLIRAGKCQPL